MELSAYYGMARKAVVIEAKLIGGPMNGNVWIIGDALERVDSKVIKLYLPLPLEMAPVASDETFDPETFWPQIMTIFYSRIANTSSYVFIGEDRDG